MSRAFVAEVSGGGAQSRRSTWRIYLHGLVLLELEPKAQLIVNLEVESRL